MALFEPYKGLSTQLNSLPIKDGQLIVTTDTKNLYIDTSSSTRIRINDDYESNNNKVVAIDQNSTDTQYPSAKCVYDLVGDIESLLTALDVGSGVQ